MTTTFKKMLQGVFGFVAAALMALTLAPGAALAATLPTNNSLTVDGLSNTDTVTVYQVVTAQTGADNVITYKFANDDNTYGNLTYDAYVAAGDSYTTASTIAAAVQNGAEYGYTATASASNGTVSFGSLPAGQYLVMVTSTDATRVYQPIIRTVVPEGVDGNWVAADVKFKADKDVKYIEFAKDQALTKQVKTADGSYADVTNTVAQGSDAHFKVTALVPSFQEVTDDTIYKVNDTASDGFDAAKNIVVSVENGTNLIENDDYTVAANGNDFVVTLKKSGITKAKGQNIVIEYDATVNSSAVADGQNVDTAKATYSKSVVDPTQTADTNNDSAYVVVYQLGVTKIAADTKQAQAGVTFTVTGPNGYSKDFITDDEGKFTVDTKLAAGVYTVTEKVAAAGYKLAAPQSYTFSTTAGNEGEIKVLNFEDEKDTTASVLPTTGGPGTIALTVAGVAVMAGAAAFIVRSRKQN